MKKRLLITSIVMMLVVAVALSTATYAWFTSNTTVTAETITMKAGTSQSTALGIEWTAGGSSGFNAHYKVNVVSVDPADTTDQAGGFQPAAPVLLDTISTHANPVFKTAFVDAQGNFKTAGVETAVYRFANYADADAATTAEDTYSNLIHVANLAQAGNAQRVYLTATIGGDAAALVRIAVYEVTIDDSEPQSPVDVYTYKGLLATTATANNTAQGAITGPTGSNPVTQQAASSLLTATAATELNLGTIAPQTDKAYAVYVWLDGAAFDESSSSKDATIALSFSTTKVAVGDITEINPAA